MSRSYRKPYVVDGYGTKRKQWVKRQANKRIRRAEVVPDGKAYRKYTNPWDISDYKWYVNSENDWGDYEKTKRK